MRIDFGMVGWEEAKKLGEAIVIVQAREYYELGKSDSTRWVFQRWWKWLEPAHL